MVKDKITKILNELKKIEPDMTRSDFQGVADVEAHEFSSSFSKRMAISNSFLRFADGVTSLPQAKKEIKCIKESKEDNLMILFKKCNLSKN